MVTGHRRTERGFCGDFNDALIGAFNNHGVTVPEKPAIVIGAKLDRGMPDLQRGASGNVLMEKP